VLGNGEKFCTSRGFALTKTVLLVGTADTKSDELAYLRNTIIALGAHVLVMDVGVLATGQVPIDITNEMVASAAHTSLAALAALGDENQAMIAMAQGASQLAAKLYCEGSIHGLLVLGGTMGTDLGLDVASALPLGVPKVLLSTVAFSHLIAPERIPPDLIMVLWAGGLYGLNSLCQSALSQAAGAAVGAMQAAKVPPYTRPMVGMTSLGKSCLSYMVALKPALEQRGFEVAVFHTTGMGGRAFEALAAQGRFAAVIDLSLQELANHVGGSCVTSGPERLTSAGTSGTPQIVAPGAADMVDFCAWQAVPTNLADRPSHQHNRLISSATSPPAMRQEVAAQIVARLAKATAPCCLMIPLHGVQAWDLPGEPLHDPAGLALMNQSLVTAASKVANPHFSFKALPMHINDAAFADAVLAQFDTWLAAGVIKAT
jgi:uncharacterized protein (UPF0261 family)